MASNTERAEEEEESASELLRDRFCLCTIPIAKAKRNGMDVFMPIVACILDLAFKYAQQLAKDIELFAQHANQKSVNMDDVILSAHRNDHMSALLGSFRNEIKAQEPQTDRKRKKTTKKADKAVVDVILIDDP